MRVAASVSTKDRHDKGLALTIEAITMQTRVPDELTVWDDGEWRDLRGVSPYCHLFKLLSARGIAWYYQPGQKQGQVKNHQATLDQTTCDFVWRVDDDEIPEPHVLETLLKFMENPKVGAAAGLVVDPSRAFTRPSFAKNRIEEIYSGQNCQWGLWETSEPEHVDHLYSTFLYRVEAAKKAGGYPKDLSPVGHREETIFTHEMKRAGYMLVVTPKCVTWHLREESGGIRSHRDPSLWERDEEVFRTRLRTWGVQPKEYAFFVLDNGIGDHILFRSIFPEILERNRDKIVVLFACYPELFKGFGGLTLGSIADAKAAFGHDLVRWNVYAWCEANNWKRPLRDAFREMYLR